LHEIWLRVQLVVLLQSILIESRSLVFEALHIFLIFVWALQILHVLQLVYRTSMGFQILRYVMLWSCRLGYVGSLTVCVNLSNTYLYGFALNNTPKQHDL